jgi:CRISPR-associated protein Cmr6
MFKGSPLYENIDYPYSPELSRGVHWHKGLWFERFFHGYNPQWEIDKAQKQRFINEVTGSCGETDSLQAHALQQAKLCEALKGQHKIFKSNWHFITGMGNNHPVENGFSWHPTLGTPYLTGATVKGLVRAWIEQWADLGEEALRNQCYEWFGSEDKDPEKQQKEARTGDLVFFDALPVEAVELQCDIMTPHGGDWYSKGGEISADTYAKTLPADWHDPNIIPFLSVKKTSFQFMVAPTSRALKRDPTKTKVQVEEAMQALSDALEFLGAGAKTAAGYGHFQEDRIVNRATLAPKDAFLDWLINDPAVDDKQIAVRFGKDYKKTQEEYKDDWDAIIKILVTEKQALLQSWSQANKNTQEGKAYKKLAGYLPIPSTRSTIPLEDSPEKLKNLLNDNLILQQQKNPELWIIQGQFDDLFDLLSTLFESESTLEEQLFELMEAETLEQQEQEKKLVFFTTHLQSALELKNKIQLEIVRVG